MRPRLRYYLPRKVTLRDDIAADVQNVFLDTNGLALEATASGGGKVPGLFFNDYAGIIPPGASVAVGSSEPVFRVSQAAASGLPRGSTLNIDGENFVVVEPHVRKPNITGMVELRLHRA